MIVVIEATTAKHVKIRSSGYTNETIGSIDDVKPIDKLASRLMDD